MEETKNQITESQPEQTAKPAKKGLKRLTSGMKSILDGNIFTNVKVIGLLPYLAFITGLGILLIFNTNYADRTIIEIGKTKRLNEELRYEYITTKAKLMQLSRQSQLVKTLASTGLKESTIPPKKILVETDKN
jgi:hypothetical protein